MYLYRFCVLCFAALWVSAAAFAQDSDTTDCLSVRQIVFPLSENDFSENEVLAEGSKVNAFYYLYQDRYTFWYAFKILENTDIHFSVSPSNDEDRYGVTVYRYAEKDFCDKLVNGGLEPDYPEKTPLFSKDKKLQYRYTLRAARGETYYISVLSMNPDDCGHFLHMESGDRKMSFHAIHRPCYDFGRLEAPDFSLTKIYPKDVGIYLEGLKTSIESTPAPPAPPVAENPAPPDVTEEKADGYSGFSETLVESAEEGIISVGDRLVLKKVYFYNNTYAFKPEADEELQQLLNFLIENPTVEVEVEGHSANDTEEIIPDPNFKGQGKEWNFKGSALKLSEKRAEAVKEYLVDNGVRKKRLTTVGYGDARKRIPDASTFEEFEQNMRVEILITAQ